MKAFEAHYDEKDGMWQLGLAPMPGFESPCCSSVPMFIHPREVRDLIRLLENMEAVTPLYPPEKGDVWIEHRPFGKPGIEWTFTGGADLDVCRWRANANNGWTADWYPEQFKDGTLTFLRHGSTKENK